MAELLTVHDPRGYPPKVVGKRLAERPESLDGKLVYLVDCLFDNSENFMRERAPWNRLLDQFVAIPSGNPGVNHGATLMLTIRLRPGAMKNDGPRQSLQLGFSQRIPEFLAVGRRAGALDGVDGRLQAVGDGRVPPGFAEKARLAIANCPELAIEIIED